jgi:hypothetical protein
MKKIFGAALAVILLCPFIHAARGEAPAGAVYYVSTRGDDANPGNEARPWRTPGFGSKQLKAGDTLVIGEGTYVMGEYYTDMITPEVCGRPDGWITIKGAEGKRPVLQGKGSLLAAVDIGGKRFIRIENLEMTSLIDAPYSGGLRQGIEAGGSHDPIKGDISHVVIRDVEIHHVEEGGINFAGNSTDVTVEKAHIHHAGGGGIGSPSAGGGKGWQRVLITDCTFEHIGLYSMGKERKSEADRPDGFGIEASKGPVEIRRTVSRFNFGDGLDSKARNTHIHHCVVADNYGDGVKLWGGGSRLENTLVYGTGHILRDTDSPWQLIVVDTRDRGTRIEITNVTAFDDPRRAGRHYPLTAQYDYQDIPIDLVLRNNIFCGSSSVFLRRCVKLTAEHNLFFNRSSEGDSQLEIDEARVYSPADISTLGTGNLYGDPMFINPSWGIEGDFHLRDGSPAIDAGVAIDGITTDLEGTPRPRGKAFDMGAFEGQ